MHTALIVLLLLYAVVFVLVATGRWRASVILSGVFCLLGICGISTLYLLPRDFFVRHPQFEDSPLHPYFAVGGGMLVLLFGVPAFVFAAICYCLG